MQGKKICFIGILALIVLGCVIAAGCTSTQTASEPIVGTWGNLNAGYGIGVDVTTFSPAGTGKECRVYTSGEKEFNNFSWKKTGDNTYRLSYLDGDIWDVKITGTDKQLEWQQVPTEVNQIAKVWQGTYAENGEDVYYVTKLFADHSGIGARTGQDNKTEVETLTWEKSGPTTYVVNCERGTRWEVTTTEAGTEPVWKEIDYSAEPVTGVHTEKFTENGKEIVSVITFNANGTGGEKRTDSDGNTTEYTFTWVKTDTDTYEALYGSDILNQLWKVTYDPQTESLKWESIKLQWVDNYMMDGKHATEIMDVGNRNGTSIEYDADGNATEYQSTWKQTAENTYMVSYNDGDVWVATYHPETYSFSWTHATVEYGND